MSRSIINLRWLCGLSVIAGLIAVAPTPCRAQANNSPVMRLPVAPSNPPAQQAPAPPPAPPQGPAIWTLDQLVQLAERTNPAIAKALGEVQSQRGTAVQAGLYPNPRFDSNTPEIIAGSATVLTSGFYQEVIVKGKRRLDQAAAREAVFKTELAYVNTRYAALTEIRTQFYQVLAAERRFAVQRELVEISRAGMRAAEQRVKAGVGTENDTLLLLVEFQNAQITASNNQIALAGTKRKLAATVGIPEMIIAGVQGDLLGPLPHFDDVELQQFIVSDNAEVRSARVDVDRNRLLLRRAEVEPYPNINIGPTYYSGLTTQRIPQQFGIQFAFELPMWNRNQGNIQSQQGTVNSAAANVGVVQNNLLGDTAITLAQHRAARERAEALSREILPSSHRTLQMTRNGYDQGVLDISTLLQAQQTLLETNHDLTDALEEAWKTAAALAGVLQREQFP